MPKGSYDIRLCEYQSIETKHIERVSKILDQIIESQSYLAFNEDVEGTGFYRSINTKLDFLKNLV